jgi:hypothetical protein
MTIGTLSEGTFRRRLRRQLDERLGGQRLRLVCAVVGLMASACAPTSGPPQTAASPSPVPTTPVPTQIIAGFPAPATYQQACDFEPSVCNASDLAPASAQSPLLAALRRPLKLPVLEPGHSCPATPGATFDTPYFGGMALGTGPVRPLGRVTAAGEGELGPGPNPAGWYGFKTLWFSAPSYQGPWLVRAAQLDGTGPVIFGEQPAVSQLVVPPIATLNGGGGYRTAPGGTYVRGPGCYAWQVDGLTFSYVIVFHAVVTAT